MEAIGLLQPYSLLLFLAHTLVLLNTIFIHHIQRRWRQVVKNLKSSEDNYTEIQSLVKELKKIPRHVAYCLNSTEFPLNQTYNMKALAELISWTWASGSSVVSLYDTGGQLRDNPTELEIYLEKAIGKLDTGKLFSELEIKFHNVTKDSKDLQGVEKLETKNKLHIIVFGPEDGKEGIVNVVKKLSEEYQNDALCRNNNQILEEVSKEDEKTIINQGITESKINKALNVSLEPNLLIIFGSSSSTLGFLPWHIRLTEIHWLPTFPTFNSSDFAFLLRSYSDCDQKVGK